MIINLDDLTSQIRRDILRMVHQVNSGHPGGSLGCAEFLAVLYFKIMKIDLNFNMNGLNEDLFFLSNGHISPVFYSTLSRRGYFPISELSTFRKINSRSKRSKYSIFSAHESDYDEGFGPHYFWSRRVGIFQRCG